MALLSASGRSGGPGRSRSGWVGYWDGLEQRPLFAVQARDHVRRLRAVVSLRVTDRVLDFGCGFGHVAELLAPDVGRMDFWDAADSMRRATARRTARLPTAVEVDFSAGDAPDGGYDLVLVNSVIQYLTPDELAGWLARWNRMLRPGGRVVVSDVLRPGGSVLPEVLGLLWFAARHRILLRTVRDGVVEVAQYRRSRQSHRLHRWQPAELARMAADAGLVAETLPANLTHFRNRFAMLLRRP
jgi:ubiquinone/menaquinone biosynthesis C-methylase UbiE